MLKTMFSKVTATEALESVYVRETVHITFENIRKDIVYIDIRSVKYKK